MSCSPGGSGGFALPTAATIDYAIASRLPKTTPLPLVSLAVHKTQSLVFVRNLTSSGAGLPITMYANPRNALSSFFGGVGDAEKRQTERAGTILDWLRQDVTRVQQQLVGDERLKFDAYLASVEQVQTTQQALFSIRSNKACLTPDINGTFSIDLIEGRTQSIFSLAAGVLQCGMTNCVTLSICTGTSFGMGWDGLGYKTSMHGIGHGRTDANGMGRDEKVCAFQCTNIAKLVESLKALPEGNGTVMDNTLICYMNENGSTHHSRPWHERQYVLLGGKNIGLKPGNQYVRYAFNESSNMPGGRRSADFFRTVAQLMGTPLSSFGKDDAASVAGPLTEILA
jgi:Protein of unknown function (DUF1552)